MTEFMTKKKTTSAHRQIRPASVKPLSAYHRLDTLLHTMRCIAQYEDALCELSHEIKWAGEMSPGSSEELRAILEQIPSHDYVLDLNAVRATLVEPRALTKFDSRTPAKSVSVRTGHADAKKSGRKSSR